MTDYTYSRYLSAKATVDDRALNKDVVACVRRELARQETPEKRIFEVGAGLGTMVARLVDWGLTQRAEYTVLDVDPQLLADSRTWLASWAHGRGHTVEPGEQQLRITGAGGLDWTVRFLEAELRSFMDTAAPGAGVDLLIANAFLDLVDVPVILRELLGILAPGGLYWFTINFDGDTIFEPTDPRDEPFMKVYHQSMDERVRYGRAAGDSKTGRHLFEHLRRAGASVLSAGASDWIVFAQGGKYEADEGYFVHHILHTIDQELEQHPAINRRDLAEWVATRHAQVESGELLYIAHQIDLCGRRS
jgi:SAM-dependent methyltransferase